MEAYPGSFLKIFTRLGIVTNVLPFYGYFEDWTAVLSSLCRDTRDFYVNNKDLLDEYEKNVHTHWHKIGELLKDWSPAKSDLLRLRNDLSLSITMDNDPKAKVFFKKAQGFKIHRLNSLIFSNYDQLGAHGMRACEKFFRGLSLRNVQVIRLTSFEYFAHGDLFKSLASVLQAARKSVEFVRFIILKQDFEIILEN